MTFDDWADDHNLLAYERKLCLEYLSFMRIKKLAALMLAWITGDEAADPRDKEIAALREEVERLHRVLAVLAKDEYKRAAKAAEAAGGDDDG